jgi:murein L,D-transpeptidase YafK
MRLRKIAALVIFLVTLACLAIHPSGAATQRTLQAAKVDKVVVIKSERRLMLMSHGRVLKSYRVALGRNPVGAKHQAGDGKTPEGLYRLDWRNPHSKFYRSIHISYPSTADAAAARAAGSDPGGDIMIHGLPNGRSSIGARHAKWDWTEGCIAVTNREIAEIWRMVTDGTLIVILP